MYESFYGFKEKPFSMLPDPGFLFLSKKHQTALTLLEYGLLNHVGFCVISGEPGAGKTTILRAMLDRVSDDTTVGLITNTHQSFGGLLDWILSVFDLHQPDLTHVEMHQIFMEYLIEEYANNRTVLLIVDEAQNMNADSLEELRMLSNVNSEKDQLLQVVLSGQPALKEMLRTPELMQFAQRIAVDYHLDSLSAAETCGYIQHRLVTAGAEKDVFTPAACVRIYDYSGGTPRLINLLCETVLVYGFADQQAVIDVDLVNEMVRERMKDSVVPLVNPDISGEIGEEAIAELVKNFPWIKSQAAMQETVEVPEQEIQSKLQAEAQPEPEPIKETVTKPDLQPDQKASKRELEKENVPVIDEQVIDQQIADQPIVDSKTASATESAKNSNAAKEALAEKLEDQQGESVVPVKEKPTAVLSTGAHAASITGNAISPAGQQAKKPGEDETRKQLIKYGVIAVFIGLVLIILAISLNGEMKPEVTQDETKDLTDPNAELEKLKMERDAALLKMEEEKKRSEDIEEKLTAEKAARKDAEKLAREQEKMRKERAKKEQAAISVRARQEAQQAERRRLAREKERKREVKYREEREKRKAAKLEEDKRMRAQEEARRLELEHLEAERELAAKKQRRQQSLAQILPAKLIRL